MKMEKMLIIEDSFETEKRLQDEEYVRLKKIHEKPGKPYAVKAKDIIDFGISQNIKIDITEDVTTAMRLITEKEYDFIICDMGLPLGEDQKMKVERKKLLKDFEKKAQRLKKIFDKELKYSRENNGKISSLTTAKLADLGEYIWDFYEEFDEDSECCSMINGGIIAKKIKKHPKTVFFTGCIHHGDGFAIAFIAGVIRLRKALDGFLEEEKIGSFYKRTPKLWYGDKKSEEVWFDVIKDLISS